MQGVLRGVRDGGGVGDIEGLRPRATRERGFRPGERRGIAVPQQDRSAARYEPLGDCKADSGGTPGHDRRPVREIQLIHRPLPCFLLDQRTSCTSPKTSASTTATATTATIA